jgi:hypothetical protein
VFPSWLERHPEEEDWEDDWRWTVFVAPPSGQMTWHIHDSELEMFDHLTRIPEHSWDGHTTEEKYERLAALPDNVMTWLVNETREEERQRWMIGQVDDPVIVRRMIDARARAEQREAILDIARWASEGETNWHGRADRGVGGDADTIGWHRKMGNVYTQMRERLEAVALRANAEPAQEPDDA